MCTRFACDTTCLPSQKRPTYQRHLPPLSLFASVLFRGPFQNGRAHNFGCAKVLCAWSAFDNRRHPPSDRWWRESRSGCEFLKGKYVLLVRTNNPGRTDGCVVCHPGRGGLLSPYHPVCLLSVRNSLLKLSFSFSSSFGRAVETFTTTSHGQRRPESSSGREEAQWRSWVWCQWLGVAGERFGTPG